MAVGRRILVVDDNPDAGEVLRMALAPHGLVRVVDSGEDALAALPEFAPQLVFLDIHMPGMDGHELARRIRAEGHVALTLVALTGRADETARLRSREAGIDVHLLKPVDLEQIDALIATLQG